MSQENVEVVQEVMAAWNSHDVERWLRCWDPTCEWVPRLRGQVEGAQTYRGREGLRRFWEEDDAVWDEFQVELHDVRQIGDEVVAAGTGRARGKESGVDTTRPFAFRFRVQGGRIVRGESYLDVTEALKAVGLSERDAHADPS
jgi:ketosteroid isomerase-like protein